MIVKELYILLSSLLILISLLTNSNGAVSGAARRGGNVSARQAIVGTWQINHAASDKLLNRVQFDLRRFPPPVLPAPENLVLATDEAGSEITINEVFEKFIRTQTLPLGENLAGESAPTDQPISVKAFWRDKKLVVEIIAARGGKMVETFEAANVNQLTVTTRVEDPRLAKPLTVRRVYDRTPNEIAPETAAISVADFPL